MKAKRNVVTNPQAYVSSTSSSLNKKTLASAIRLTNYELGIEVRGLVCLVSVTATFYNSLDEDVEGTLKFTVPDGTMVSGFALDIDGSLEDATCVAKDKGQFILETEEHEKIDPGLLEYVDKNHVKIQVYPFPACESRTVRIDWIQTVKWDTKTESAICRIPVGFDSPVKKFTININVTKTKNVPDIQKVQVIEPQYAMKFQTNEDNQRVATFYQENYTPQKDIVIQIPNLNLEVAQFDRTVDGAYCVFPVNKYNFDPELWCPGLHDEGDEVVSKWMHEPEYVTIFWDCSGSRAYSVEHNKSKELAFLSQWLKQSNIQAVQLVPVSNMVEYGDVCLFYLEDGPKNRYHFDDSDNDNSWFFMESYSKTKHQLINDVITSIEKLPCDGSSRMDSISDFFFHTSLDGDAFQERFMLFSDGLTTDSDAELKMFGTLPLFVFSSGKNCNTHTLQRWASSNNGRYFDLNTLQKSDAVKQFCDALHKQWDMIGVSGHGLEVYPQYISATDDQPFAICCCKTDKMWAEASFQTDLRSHYHHEIHSPAKWFECGPDDFPDYLPDGSENDDFNVEEGPRSIVVKEKTNDTNDVTDSEEQKITVLIEDLPLIKTSNKPTTLEYIAYQQSSASWADCSVNQRFPIRALYAQMKLLQLLDDPIPNADAICQLGKQYAFPTPSTSLIVLENHWQYEKYDIRQAGSSSIFDDDVAEMEKILSGKHESSDKTPEDYPEFMSPSLKKIRLEYLKKVWDNRVEWWNTKPGAFPTSDEVTEKNRTFESETQRQMRDWKYFGSKSSSQFGEYDDFDYGDVNYSMPLLDSTPAPYWDPEMLFLKEMNSHKLLHAMVVYKTYLKFRNKFANDSVFYLDCADWVQSHVLQNSITICSNKYSNTSRIVHSSRNLAIRILSNLEKLDLENSQPLRVMAYRLEQLGAWSDAVRILRNILIKNPRQPESYRDLALALVQMAKHYRIEDDINHTVEESYEPSTKQEISDPRLEWYTEALSLLKPVILGREFHFWGCKFLEDIALEEFNAILPQAQALGPVKCLLPQQFIQHLDYDIRIVLTCFDDAAKISLLLFEPSGSLVYKDETCSQDGGLFSNNHRENSVEEYVIRHAVQGKYTIVAKYTDVLKNPLPSKIFAQVDVFINYARPNQTQQTFAFSLTRLYDEHLVGEIDFT